MHDHFMILTLHGLPEPSPPGVVSREFRIMSLQLQWQNLVLNHVRRLSELPSDRLVKKACTHASSVNTLWRQNLSLSNWLSQNGFEGVLAERIIEKNPLYN